MREVELPSGAVLKVNPAPFAQSKALYQAMLRELRSISITDGTDIGEIVKNAFCAGFSSPEIDACLTKCFDKCLYNDTRMDKDTFEAVECRADYASVCVEVTKENVGPFVKSLFADYKQAVSMLVGIRK